MSNGMTNVVELLASESETPETLGPLHLTAERRHERGAVVQRRDKDAWSGTPDWRFHRHIIRIALYLRQRGGLKPGDRVAIVAPVGLEWLVAAWAVMLEGAATVALDPRSGQDAWLDVWKRTSPRIAFAADEAVARTLSTAAKDARIVLLDGACPTEACVTFSEALDLGGSLDTAERANEFRARVRELSPAAPAVAYEHGQGEWRYLTQRDVLRKLRAQWLALPPRAGDIAYATSGAPSLALQLALHGLVSDGRSCVSFGTRGHESEELAQLRPRFVVSRSGIAEVPRTEAAEPAATRATRWREWISRIPQRLRAKQHLTTPQSAGSSRPGGSP
jgi:hypothetical protein